MREFFGGTGSGPNVERAADTGEQRAVAIPPGCPEQIASRILEKRRKQTLDEILEHDPDEAFFAAGENANGK